MKRKELWFDIDTATRSQMAMCFAQERRRIANLLTQIVIDMEHFNELHPDEEPLIIVLDFNNDVIENRLGKGN
jgi:hypothetical protein